MHNSDNNEMYVPFQTPNQNNESVVPEQSKETMMGQEQDMEDNNQMDNDNMQMKNYKMMRNK